jgi:sec-independent protein translocase protein TatA
MLTGILEPTHLIIILIVALVFLGPKRLPDAGRALGQGLNEFRRSLSGEHDDSPAAAARPAVPSEDEPGSAATPR